MSRTLLVVDDEPDIRELARLSLERVGGFTVHTAGSADEALAVVEQARPDLVLLDVMMPGTDGPTLLGRIRRSPGGGEVPVVFLTASVQDHQLAGLRALDVKGVLSKPFDPMTLPDQVREVAGWAGT
ncbi:MAG: response regulator [Motilibacteraceae bacterium]